MFKWLFKKKGCAKHMNNKLEGMGDYYEEDKYYLIIRSTGLFNGCL